MDLHRVLVVEHIAFRIGIGGLDRFKNRLGDMEGAI